MAAKNAGAEHFTIQNLAEQLEVSVKTLKKWEQQSKIPQARRTPFGWRVYTKQELDKIERLVKDNGFFVKSNGIVKPKM